MPRPLVDLLWRDSPAAPAGGSRGPRARQSTGEVVGQAIMLADTGGLPAVTIRGLAQALGLTAMSVYTYVNSREDLLVLMADQAHTQMPRTPFGRSGWRSRVRRIAEDNLALCRAHLWLLDISDPRTALGPGTIAKYDHELRAFDGTRLRALDRDAALTFVLDFARASAGRIVQTTGDFGPVWDEAVDRLAGYLGQDYPLAQEVGRVAGESMGGPYDAERAWEFGLGCVLEGLSELIGRLQEPADRLL